MSVAEFYLAEPIRWLQQTAKKKQKPHCIWSLFPVQTQQNLKPRLFLNFWSSYEMDQSERISWTWSLICTERHSGNPGQKFFPSYNVRWCIEWLAGMPTLCPSVRVELCLHDRFYATFNNMLLIIKAYLWNNIGQLQRLA